MGLNLVAIKKSWCNEIDMIYTLLAFYMGKRLIICQSCRSQGGVNENSQDRKGKTSELDIQNERKCRVEIEESVHNVMSIGLRTAIGYLGLG